MSAWRSSAAGPARTPRLQPAAGDRGPSAARPRPGTAHRSTATPATAACRATVDRRSSSSRLTYTSRRSTAYAAAARCRSGYGRGLRRGRPTPSLFRTGPPVRRRDQPDPPARRGHRRRRGRPRPPATITIPTCIAGNIPMPTCRRRAGIARPAAAESWPEAGGFDPGTRSPYGQGPSRSVDPAGPGYGQSCRRCGPHAGPVHGRVADRSSSPAGRGTARSAAPRRQRLVGGLVTEVCSPGSSCYDGPAPDPVRDGHDAPVIYGTS